MLASLMFAPPVTLAIVFVIAVAAFLEVVFWPKLNLAAVRRRRRIRQLVRHRVTGFVPRIAEHAAHSVH